MASKDVQAQLDRLAVGDPLEGGWCLDFDRDPAVFPCTPELEAVSKDEASVSIDGGTVTNLKDGTVKKGPTTLQKDRGVKVPVTTSAPTLNEARG